MAEEIHVTVSGGRYVVEETLAEGRVVLVPEWPSQETSAEAILWRGDGERLSPEEFERHFGDLPSDGEG